MLKRIVLSTSQACVRTEIFNLHNNRRHTRDLKMGERKTVSRNVVVALGVVCTILVVLLSGSILLYTENISTLNFEKKVLQGNVNDLTVEKTNLQIQVNDLNNIVNLNRSKIWVFNQTNNIPSRFLGRFHTSRHRIRRICYIHLSNAHERHDVCSSHLLFT